MNHPGTLHKTRNSSNRRSAVWGYAEHFRVLNPYSTWFSDQPKRKWIITSKNHPDIMNGIQHFDSRAEAIAAIDEYLEKLR